MADIFGKTLTDVIVGRIQDALSAAPHTGLDSNTSAPLENKTVHGIFESADSRTHGIELNVLSVKSGAEPEVRFSMDVESYLNNGTFGISDRVEFTARGETGDFRDIEITRAEYFEEGYKEGAVPTEVYTGEGALEHLSNAGAGSPEDKKADVEAIKDSLIKSANAVGSRKEYSAVDAQGIDRNITVCVDPDTRYSLGQISGDEIHMHAVTVFDDSNSDPIGKYICDRNGMVVADMTDGKFNATSSVDPARIPDYLERETGIRISDENKTAILEQYDKGIEQYKDRMASEVRAVTYDSRCADMLGPSGNRMDLEPRDINTMSFFIKRPVTSGTVDYDGSTQIRVLGLSKNSTEYTRDEVVNKISSLNGLTAGQKTELIDSLQNMNGRWMIDYKSDKANGRHLLEVLSGGKEAVDTRNAIRNGNRVCVTSYDNQLQRISGYIDRADTTFTQFEAYLTKDFLSKDGRVISDRELGAFISNPRAIFESVNADEASITRATDAVTAYPYVREEITSLKEDIVSLRNDIYSMIKEDRAGHYDTDTIDTEKVKDKFDKIVEKIDTAMENIRQKMEAAGDGESFSRLEGYFSEFEKTVLNDFGCVFDKESGLFMDPATGLSLNGDHIVFFEKPGHQMEDVTKKVVDNFVSTDKGLLQDQDRIVSKIQTSIEEIFNVRDDWKAKANGMKIHDPVFNISSRTSENDKVLSSRDPAEKNVAHLPVSNDVKKYVHNAAPGGNTGIYRDRNLRAVDRGLAVMTNTPVENLRPDTREDIEKSRERKGVENREQAPRDDVQNDYVNAQMGFSKSWELTGDKDTDRFISARNIMIDHYKMTPTLPSRTVTMKVIEINAIVRAHAAGKAIYSPAGDVFKVVSNIYGILTTNFINTAISLAVCGTIDACFGATEDYKKFFDSLAGRAEPDINIEKPAASVDKGPGGPGSPGGGGSYRDNVEASMRGYISGKNNLQQVAASIGNTPGSSPVSSNSKDAVGAIQSVAKDVAAIPGEAGIKKNAVYEKLGQIASQIVNIFKGLTFKDILVGAGKVAPALAIGIAVIAAPKVTANAMSVDTGTFPDNKAYVFEMNGRTDILTSKPVNAALSAEYASILNDYGIRYVSADEASEILSAKDFIAGVPQEAAVEIYGADNTAAEEAGRALEAKDTIDVVADAGSTAAVAGGASESDALERELEEEHRRDRGGGVSNDAGDSLPKQEGGPVENTPKADVESGIPDRVGNRQPDEVGKIENKKEEIPDQGIEKKETDAPSRVSSDADAGDKREADGNTRVDKEQPDEPKKIGNKKEETTDQKLEEKEADSPSRVSSDADAGDKKEQEDNTSVDKRETEQDKESVDKNDPASLRIEEGQDNINLATDETKELDEAIFRKMKLS